MTHRRPLWLVDRGMEDYERLEQDTLRRAFDAEDIDVIWGTYIPFGGGVEFEPAEFDLPTNVYADSRPVVLYGQVGFTESLQDQLSTWTPGVFNTRDELACHQYYAKFRPEWMLQEDFELLPWATVKYRYAAKQLWSSTFVRPDGGTKACKGTVLNTPEDLDALEVVNYGYLTDTTLMLIAPTRTILAEYRTFVTDGLVVAASQYRRNEILDIRRDIDDDSMRFAQMIASAMQPFMPAAYALDIATTPAGPRVIEVNSWNNSGWYACDKAAIIRSASAAATRLFETRHG